MNNSEYTDEQKFHHYMGTELHNQTWNLLGKNKRTEKDNQRMIFFAQGSLYHWLRSPVFEKVNEQRGEWMVSHVYAVVGHGTKALKSAERCLALTQELRFKDFDLGYALEGMARAYAANGNTKAANAYFDEAIAAAEQIQGGEDRTLFLNDLASGPWYDTGLPR